MRPIVVSSLLVFGIGVAVPLVVWTVLHRQTPVPVVLTAQRDQSAAPKAIPPASVTPKPARPAPTDPAAALPVARPSATEARAKGSARATRAEPYLRDLERGRTLTAWLYAQQTQKLWTTFLPSVRADWNDAQAFADYRSAGRRLYGHEVQVVQEEVRARGATHYYIRTVRFAQGPRKQWSVIFGLTPSGRISEFGVVDAGASTEALLKAR